MAEEPAVLDENEAIKDTDIVFDCPHCGKSLAIDYRGAGLTITCSDCGNRVEVPIPEGMELTDIDSNQEEQELRILHLRRAVTTAEFRIRQLEEENQALRDARDSLEKQRTEILMQFGAMLEQVTGSRKALADLYDRLRALSRTFQGPTR